MARRLFDTRAWNLTLGGATVLATSACGPAVLIPGETDGGTETGPGSTQTDGQTETETFSTSGPSTTSTPPNPTEPVECYTDEDCPGAYYDCIDNQCIEEYYCLDCCYDDCYYSECYDDNDCGVGSICNTDYGYGDCEPSEEIPACEENLDLMVLPVMTPAAGSIRSLAFVDRSDGGEDLVIGQDAGASILRGPSAMVEPVGPPSTSAVVGAAAGEFTNDSGNQLIALAQESAQSAEIALYQLNEEQTYEFVGRHDLGTQRPLDLHTNRGEAGYQDFIVPLEEFLGVRVTNDVEPFSSELPLGFRVIDIVAEGDDLAIEQGEFERIIVMREQVIVERGILGRGARRLALAPGSGDVFATTPMNGWLLVETLQRGEGTDLRSSIVTPLADEGRALETDAGDIDGNGEPDLVLVDGTTLTIAFRDQSRFTCYSSVELSGSNQHLEVGRWSGDDADSIAVSDGLVVQVLRAGTSPE